MDLRIYKEHRWYSAHGMAECIEVDSIFSHIASVAKKLNNVEAGCQHFKLNLSYSETESTQTSNTYQISAKLYKDKNSTNIFI